MAEPFKASKKLQARPCGYNPALSLQPGNLWVLGFGFWVLGFGFGVWGLGFGFWGVVFTVWGCRV